MKHGCCQLLQNYLQDTVTGAPWAAPLRPLWEGSKFGMNLLEISNFGNTSSDGPKWEAADRCCWRAGAEGAAEGGFVLAQTQQ